jgi:putative transposase
VTDARQSVFVQAAAVDLVRQQILRAAQEERFAVIAYCFMADHLHLIVGGEDEGSDCKGFIKAAKQYSGYYFSVAYRSKLWERYGHDRVIRDERELAMTLRYLLANPVRAGLVKHPRDYPFLGSAKYTVEELLQWCEYSQAILL